MIRVVLLASLLAAPASAAPNVIADLPVVQGLTEAVMGEGEVGRLLDAFSDPHHAALRPSQAAAIEAADLLVMIGGGLMPSLERVAPDGKTLALASEAAPGDARHEEHGGTDGDVGAGGSEAHADPHVWLDPDVAVSLLAPIAAHLSRLEGDRTGAYHANADAARRQIEAAAAAARDRIAQASAPRFLAAHDAWHHAEEALGLNVVGAIADGHAVAPGARGLQRIEDLVEEGGADCLLVSSGEDLAHAERIAMAHDLPVVEVSVLGAEDKTGAARYTDVLDQIAAAAERCAAR